MPGTTFEILIDESLSNVTTLADLQAVTNKHLLSFVNDFEDTKWRYPKFQSYLWNNIAQTALSERERSSLVNQSHSELVESAKNLRLTDKDKTGQGSEIAEVFLYGVMRNHFNALPVVPKIFYKQNTQDNAKGADSVHIVIADDDFTLWFGEAKFYNSVADARLDSVVDSVIKSLNTTKLRKENSIITNVCDLDALNISKDLIGRIKTALSSKESIDYLKPKIHVPIMLVHQCEETYACNSMTDRYRDEIRTIHKERAESYFGKQIKKSGQVHRYDDITFHLLLFPVPRKSIIVDAFLNSVAFYKGQA